MYHQIGTLQIAPLHVLSHFAANVCPQGFPQTLTIPAVQKDKVGLLQMSKFEASKDFPQEPHHPHRTTSLFGDFKQIDMTTGRAAECTARAGISITFWWCCNLKLDVVLSNNAARHTRPSRDLGDDGYACTGEFQSLPLPPWKAHIPLRQHQSQNLDAGLGKNKHSNLGQKQIWHSCSQNY